MPCSSVSNGLVCLQAKLARDVQKRCLIWTELLEKLKELVYKNWTIFKK